MSTEEEKSKTLELDRISSLPDCLLIEILSLLSNRKAAQTSVLSKRWEELWTWIPIIDLADYESHNSGYDNETDFKSFRELVTAVDFILMRNTAPRLSKFAVTSDSYRNNNYISHVDNWMRVLMKKKVKELDLALGNSYELRRYSLPQFFYKNSSIEKLMVSYCCVNPQRQVDWVSLKHLVLDSMSMTEDSIEKICLGCPRLETLELVEVLGIHSLYINSSSIRKLVVEGHSHNQQVDILAPNIHSLVLKGSFEDPIGLDAPSLIEADIRFFFFPEINWFPRLLQSIPHVTNLSLSSCSATTISEMKQNGLPSLQLKVKCLSVDISPVLLCHLPGFITFLKSLPDMETLVLDFTTFDTQEEKIYEALMNELSLLPRVKTITIPRRTTSCQDEHFEFQDGILCSRDAVILFLRDIVHNEECNLDR